MRIALVYTSLTGNTEAITQHVIRGLEDLGNQVDVIQARQLPADFDLSVYDGLVVGTYTWGDGIIPKEMQMLYDMIELQSPAHLVTGVYGTGDRFYPKFCGAVDRFRDMLFHHTQLAVTLKVESMPQASDIEKVKIFASRILGKHQIAYSA